MLPGGGVHMSFKYVVVLMGLLIGGSLGLVRSAVGKSVGGWRRHRAPRTNISGASVGPTELPGHEQKNKEDNSGGIRAGKARQLAEKMSTKPSLPEAQINVP